jgi:sulfur relay (sulfurtransferase) DsrC/TusE family protein
MAIPLDSKGIKLEEAGRLDRAKLWEEKWYLKLHSAIKVETNKVFAMKVTTDKMHNVKLLRRLFNEFMVNARVYRDS